MNNQKFTVDLSNKTELKNVIAELTKTLNELEDTSHLRSLHFDPLSMEDCKRVLNQIKSTIGLLKSETNGSKNQRIREQFFACQNIWNADLSSLFSEMELDAQSNYYVYVHCDPGAKIAIGRDGRSSFGATIGMTHLPFYVGKGVGSRAFDLNRNETHRKIRQNLSSFNKEPVVLILKNDLTELEALSYESKLIDIFGVIGKGGRLCNLDEGIKSNERRNMYTEDLKKINILYKELL